MTVRRKRAPMNYLRKKEQGPRRKYRLQTKAQRSTQPRPRREARAIERRFTRVS